jgi:hypothetical protein
MAQKHDPQTADGKLATILGTLVPAGVCFTTVGMLWYLPGILLSVSASLLIVDFWRGLPRTAIHPWRWVSGLGALISLLSFWAAFWRDAFGLFWEMVPVRADRLLLQILPMDVLRRTVYAFGVARVETFESGTVMVVYLLFVLGAGIALIASLASSRLSVPYIIYLFYALFAVLIVVVILAVTDLLQDDAPFLMRLAVIAAGGTSVLFIAYAMLGYVGEPVLVSLYKQDPALAGTVYMSVRMVSNALNTGAIFTSGWAILLVGLAALRTGRLGRPIAYVLILAGLFAVMSFVVPVFALLAPLLYIVWSIWLGVILLRSQQRRPIP